MQHRATPRSGTAGRTGRRILLLLALAACGRGSGDKAPAKPTQGGPDTVVAKGPPRARTDTCVPSPAVDSTLLARGGAWEPLQKLFADARFVNSNPDTTEAAVQLCRECNPVRMRIVSESRTSCNTTGSMDRTTRLAGVWVVLEGTVTPPGWDKTFGPNDSIFLFAHDTAHAPALVVYPLGDSTVERRVGRAPRDAWNFHYCQDGHQPAGPQGRWRPLPPTARGAGRDSLPTPNDPGTYGWMACASGCCQFYIPPKEEGGGRGRGRGLGAAGDTVPPCPEPGR